MPPITTKSGACRHTTTVTCTSCSRSRARRPGLSWSTILRKREGYRRVFEGFDPERVSAFDRRKIERLLKDPAIVRNRLKVESTVNNAQRIVEVQEECGSLDSYIWRFVEGQPIVGRWRKLQDLPAEFHAGR